MSIEKLSEKIKKEWNYLLIEGSPLGNTSFLVQFIKHVIIGDKDKESARFERLLGLDSQILYLRSEAPKISEKKVLDEITKLAFIEYIESPEIFNYRTILKYLQNRNYNYLIVDDPRQEDNYKVMDNFSEILTYCEGQIKVISSLITKRQKVDYSYHEADLILNVNASIGTGFYEVAVEDKNAAKISNYLIPLK